MNDHLKAAKRHEEKGNFACARRLKAESAIAMAIVNGALSEGFTVSVNDGEEWTLKRSTDKTAIEAALFTTDEDLILLRDKAGEKAGWFRLIYGNDGYDVVNDYTLASEPFYKKHVKPEEDKQERLIG